MYHFRLLRTDGSPADPATFRSSTLNWRQGDKIYLTGERKLRVLGVRNARISRWRYRGNKSVRGRPRSQGEGQPPT